MAKISEESKKKLEDYVKKGYLKQDIILQVWRDYPPKKIVDTLKEYIFINEITLTKVWTYIIYTEWKDLDTIFDKKEVLLLKTLIWNNGVMLRSQIKTNSLNEYMTTKAIETLSERNIIDIILISKNQKIIIMHPKFIYKIFKEEQ